MVLIQEDREIYWDYFEWSARNSGLENIKVMAKRNDGKIFANLAIPKGFSVYLSIHKKSDTAIRFAIGDLVCENTMVSYVDSCRTSPDISGA
jgi:hypothetical protein